MPVRSDLLRADPAGVPRLGTEPAANAPPGTRYGPNPKTPPPALRPAPAPSARTATATATAGTGPRPAGPGPAVAGIERIGPPPAATAAQGPPPALTGRELTPDDLPSLLELREGVAGAVAGEPVEGLAAPVELELLRRVPDCPIVSTTARPTAAGPGTTPAAVATGHGPRGRAAPAPGSAYRRRRRRGRAASSSDHGRVLSTASGPSQARRAVAIP